MAKLVQMEITLHPSPAEIVTEPDDDFELETGETWLYPEDLTKVPASMRLARIRARQKAIEALQESEFNLFELTSFEKNDIPRLTLDIDKLKPVKISTDLLYNLDLTFRYKKFNVYNSDVEFEENLSYDAAAKRKLKRLTLNRGAYLKEDYNYFELDKTKSTKETEIVALRNSRVILFWRGFSLKEVNYKRIITLGFNLLIGNLSFAETTYYIKELVPKGTFEVSIKYMRNNYVFIGIEKPIFS